MTLLIGSMTIGFILSLLALGILISFRIFDFPDITAEGSITLGAAVAATLLVHGVGPVTATFTGVIAGMLAGAATGVLHTKFKINGLLSGILVMTALYSINLHVMGRSNVPLLSTTTFVTQAEGLGDRFLHGAENFNVFGWEVERARPFRAFLFFPDRRCGGSCSLRVFSHGFGNRDARHRR